MKNYSPVTTNHVTNLIGRSIRKCKNKIALAPSMRIVATWLECDKERAGHTGHMFLLKVAAEILEGDDKGKIQALHIHDFILTDE